MAISSMEEACQVDIIAEWTTHKATTELPNIDVGHAKMPTPSIIFKLIKTLRICMVFLASTWLHLASKMGSVCWALLGCLAWCLESWCIACTHRIEWKYVTPSWLGYIEWKYRSILHIKMACGKTSCSCSTWIWLSNGSRTLRDIDGGN